VNSMNNSQREKMERCVRFKDKGPDKKSEKEMMRGNRKVAPATDSARSGDYNKKAVGEKDAVVVRRILWSKVFVKEASQRKRTHKNHRESRALWRVASEGIWDKCCV
jgi:hypothetical protein